MSTETSKLKSKEKKDWGEKWNRMSQELRDNYKKYTTCIVGKGNEEEKGLFQAYSNLTNIPVS